MTCTISSLHLSDKVPSVMTKVIKPKAGVQVDGRDDGGRLSYINALAHLLLDAGPFGEALRERQNVSGTWANSLVCAMIRKASKDQAPQFPELQSKLRDACGETPGSM